MQSHPSCCGHTYAQHDWPHMPHTNHNQMTTSSLQQVFNRQANCERSVGPLMDHVTGMDLNAASHLKQRKWGIRDVLQLFPVSYHELAKVLSPA